MKRTEEKKNIRKINNASDKSAAARRRRRRRRSGFDYYKRYTHALRVYIYMYTRIFISKVHTRDVHGVAFCVMSSRAPYGGAVRSSLICSGRRAQGFFLSGKLSSRRPGTNMTRRARDCFVEIRAAAARREWENDF